MKVLSTEEVTSLKENDFMDYVDTLENTERVTLREELKKLGSKYHLLRSLYYNYDTQQWID